MCTRKNNGEYYEIQISKRLLEDDNISVKSCKDTMIHEILHTCPDCMKHTGKWKEYARNMNTKYGYNIKSTTSGAEKGVENYKAKRQSIKYMFSCRHCSHTELYKKKCKFTHYYRNYSCPVCGKPRAYRKIEIAGRVFNNTIGRH